MIERIITNAKRNSNGEIIEVGNPVEWWSPRTASEVIYDIEESFYNYFIMLEGKKVLVKVVNGSGEKRLRTDPEITQKNILADLPSF